VDAIAEVAKAQEAKSKILVEGANAIMLDIDFGTYPYVTSSNTGIGGVITGLGLSVLGGVKDVIGVVKAYTTRVGSGPFPTEQLNEVGTSLQKIGHEVGVTTGRPRRCGWLDLVVVKYSTAVNNYNSLNVTKLDILDTFKTIKIAVSYSHKGKKLASFPADLDVLGEVDVEYVELPGWETETTGCKTFEELPRNAREYLEFIQTAVGVRVGYVGTGPGREAMIVR
jgi:adenylosuccinate synthase